MPRPPETVFHATVDSPRGPARFVTTEKGICAISLPGRESGWLDRWIACVISNPVMVEGTASDPHVAGARDQIATYFAGRSSNGAVPLDLRGTPFQQAVWREV